MRTGNFFTVTIAFIALLTCAFADDWKPLDKADLAAKAGKVDPSADAEILLWDVRVLDELLGGNEPRLSLFHYLRIQLYNQRAIEKYGDVKIELPPNHNIGELAARVVQPDGSIVEVDKKQFLTQDDAKAGRRKAVSVSFALPKLVPGSIIEYRYREYRQNQLANYIRLYFQRELPIREVTYHVKPLNLPWLPWAMRVGNFQCPSSPFAREPQGFYFSTLKNVPAYKAEGNSPPEDQLRAWLLIYYAEDKKLSPEKYWREAGKDLYNTYKKGFKVSSEMKTLAAELTSGRSSDEEKLAALHDWVRKNMKNASYNVEGEISKAERKKMQETDTTVEFFKLRAGTRPELNMVFAALATAAGFDAVPFRAPDRSDTFLDKGFLDLYFLRHLIIGVKLGDTWKLYDPGTPWMPAGSLRWEHEDVEALMLDGKQPAFVATPRTPSKVSLAKRSGKMKLEADGSLSGPVRVEFTGHFANEERERLYGDSEAEITERVKNYFETHIGAGEVTGAKAENLDQPGKPLVFSAQIEVEGYAERTGKRFFFMPNVFERSMAARFADSKRTHPIYFHYGYTVEDSVRVDLPQGFRLEDAEAPQSTKISDVGEYTVQLRKANDESFIQYDRKLEFGKSGGVIFPAESYKQLKAVFDFMHQQDHHTLTLREGASQ